MSYKLINKLLTAAVLLQAPAFGALCASRQRPRQPNASAGAHKDCGRYPFRVYSGRPKPANQLCSGARWDGQITDTVQFAAAAYMDVRETAHYFDGLGRPLQAVQRQMTPGSSPADMVTPVVYDAFGREVYKYLPYVAGSEIQAMVD